MVQRNGRIAEQRILQFVHRDITIEAPELDQFVLRQSLGLTQGHRLAIVAAQDIPEISIVNQTVIVLIHCTCRSINRHGTTVIVRDRRYADIIFHAIERHDVTGCEDPQRQVFVREGFIIVEHQDLLMRQLRGTAVTAIVHDQCTLRLLLLDKIRHLGIGITRRRSHLGVGIPHHFLDAVSGMQRLHRLHGFFGITHVDVVVAVIAHEHQGVLPVAGIGILHITDGLVDHHLGISFCKYGEAADSHIAHVEFLPFVTCAEVRTLAIIKISEETVIDIAVDGIEGVFALISQEEVIGIEALTVGGQQTVIPHATTEEQEILRQILLCLCTVVEHLHVTAISVGIGGTA